MNMISFSNELSCTISAPTSSRFFQEEIIKCFNSVPTSPTFKGKTSSHEDDDDDDANYSNVDDEFEFETSRRFNNLSDFDDVDSRQEDEDEEQNQKPQMQRGDSMPSMAFADELFCDGKVLPLVVPPLKLPPRLQNSASDNKINVPSSSRSFGSARRLQFLRRSFWNDDFDPFMEALEVVKGGEVKKSKEKLGIRRTRSLSPFRGKSPNRPNSSHYGPEKRQRSPIKLYEPKVSVFGGKSLCKPSDPHCGPDKLISEVSKDPLKERLRSPKKLCEPKGSVFRGKSSCKPSDPHYGPAQLTCEFPKQKSTSSNMLLYEPKGLVFARRVVDKNGPIEPNKTKEERKRKKIRRFLFGKASVEQHKFEDQKEELGKLLGLELDKHDKVRELKKMTLNNYKPRLLLCLGYGGRYVKS